MDMVYIILPNNYSFVACGIYACKHSKFNILGRGGMGPRFPSPGSAPETIRRVVKRLDFADTHVLMNYLDEIRSFEGDLQGLKKEIHVSLNDMGKGLQKASDIKGTLFNLHVAILHLMERMKKRPTLQAF